MLPNAVIDLVNRHFLDLWKHRALRSLGYILPRMIINTSLILSAAVLLNPCSAVQELTDTKSVAVTSMVELRALPALPKYPTAPL